jgi:hypothetical protein
MNDKWHSDQLGSVFLKLKEGKIMFTQKMVQKPPVEEGMYK